MIFYSFSNNFSLKILNDLNDRDLNDHLPAAYMQLETPSEVAIAVRMLMAI